MKNIKDYLIIVFFSILVRIFGILFIFNEKYWFLNKSSPYYVLSDSWYYARILSSNFPNIIIFFIMSIFSITSFLIFYRILIKLQINKKISLIVTLFFSSSYYILKETLFGYVDTTHFIILIIVLLIYILLFFKKIKQIICLLLLFFISIQFWSGSLLLFGAFILILIIVFIINTEKISHKILYSSLLVCLFFVFKNFIYGLLKLKMLGVAEYSTPTNIFYYLFSTLCIYYIIKTWNNNEKYHFIYVGFVVFFCLSIIFLRISTFASIFMFIILAIIINKKTSINLFIMFLFYVFFISNILSLINITPNINRCDEILIRGMDSPNNEIINLWDNGHIINFFSNKKTSYYAFPEETSLSRFTKGLNLNENTGKLFIDAISKNKSYYLYINRLDYNKILNNNDPNSILLKLKRNISLNNYKVIACDGSFLLWN